MNGTEVMKNVFAEVTMLWMNFLCGICYTVELF